MHLEPQETPTQGALPTASEDSPSLGRPSQWNKRVLGAYCVPMFCEALGNRRAKSLSSGAGALRIQGRATWGSMVRVCPVFVMAHRSGRVNRSARVSEEARRLRGC